jgi:hypothetical protein
VRLHLHVEPMQLRDAEHKFQSDGFRQVGGTTNLVAG